MYGLNEVDTLKACGAVFGTHEMLDKQLTTTILNHLFFSYQNLQEHPFLRISHSNYEEVLDVQKRLPGSS